MDTQPAGEASVAEMRYELKMLQMQFKMAVVIGTLAIAGLSGLGISKVADIESKARERIDAALAKTLEYSELMANAQARQSAGYPGSAVGYVERAYALRPDDEFTFTVLLNNYVDSANIEAGLKLVDSAGRDALVRKFPDVWTQLAAARLYMIAGVKDSKHIPNARYHFGRAERAAHKLNDGERAYVLYSAAIFQYLTGNEKEAAETLQRLADMEPRVRGWPEGDRLAPWFQELQKVHPGLQADLERMLAPPESAANENAKPRS